MSTIQVKCPQCRKSFRIPAKFAGRDGECSSCAAVFHIPGPSVVADTPDEVVTESRAPAFHSAATEELPAYDPDASAPLDEFESPLIELTLSDDDLLDDEPEVPTAVPRSPVKKAPPKTSDDDICDDNADDSGARPSRHTAKPAETPAPRAAIRSEAVREEPRPRRASRSPDSDSSTRTDKNRESEDQSSDRSRSHSRNTGADPGGRPGRSTKQTAIVVGGGVALLLLAGGVSQFLSSGPTASQPTLDALPPAATDTGRPDRSRPPDSTATTGREDTDPASTDSESTRTPPKPVPPRASGGGF